MVEFGTAYSESSVSVISVLTESPNFAGSLQDMVEIRKAVNHLPNRPAILRKDFILDEYQLHESVAYGADTALLIVSILTPVVLKHLIDVCLLRENFSSVFILHWITRSHES